MEINKKMVIISFIAAPIVAWLFSGWKSYFAELTIFFMVLGLWWNGYYCGIKLKHERDRIDIIKGRNSELK